jgi:hypothetical protein
MNVVIAWNRSITIPPWNEYYCPNPAALSRRNRASVFHQAGGSPVGTPAGATMMLRQMVRDAMFTLQVTGSLATAIMVAAAPLARHAFRR